MKREFLESLKIDPETVDKIMKENGKDIESVRAKYADYEDIKKQLETANSTLEKFKDYDQTKADVEKYKAELKKAQEESAVKIAAMERTAKVTDYLNGKKFVNKITQEAIKKSLADALADEKNAGKNLDEIFAELTKDEKNILDDSDEPNPPVIVTMKDSKSSKDDEDAKIDMIMGLNPKGKE